MSTKGRSAGRRQSPNYRLDDQVGFLLRRAYQRAGLNLVKRIGAYSLTPPQFATLARLHEQGEISQNQLGRLVAMEPANIRDVVQRLKKGGLVETKRDAEDARLIIVRLTTSGCKLTREMLPLEMASTAETLAPLSQSERDILYDLLRRLIKG